MQVYGIVQKGAKCYKNMCYGNFIKTSGRRQNIRFGKAKTDFFKLNSKDGSEFPLK